MGGAALVFLANGARSCSHRARSATPPPRFISARQVRQWPGNGADMDFRGVIRGCTAVMVAAPIVEGKLTGELMVKSKDRAAFLESAEGKAAKRSLFAFRIWCVVELHSALEFGVPIVIRAGTAARDGDQVTYNTDGAVDMLENLSFMIDVEKAECAVQADYDREIKNVREGVGADTVNKRVAGVVTGGVASAATDILEVDAAVCGEPEALRELPDDRVADALNAAAAGGRLAAVEVLLARGVVDLSSNCHSLRAASGGGHLEVVQALLGAGAAVNRASNDGRTPLSVASRNGHVEVVALLQERAGASVKKCACLVS